MRNVLPDWAVRMLVGTLLLPALLAALDGWFRARRRHLRPGRWVGWVGACALPPLLAWLWLRLLGLTSALTVPATPVQPDLYPLETAGIVALCSTAVVGAVGWFGLRPLIVSRLAPGGSAAAGGLAAATGLVVNAIAAFTWLFNPYAAALLLPAAHLWLLAAAPGSRLRGPWAALPVALGVAPPLLAAVALRHRAGPQPALADLAARPGDGRRAHLGRRRDRGLAVAGLPGRAARRPARAPPGRGDR